jgi:hypothetical protein
MATTTNYSWTTPDDTDLVKDGASAIRTLGSAIDTTVFTNAGAAVAKATVDAKGDLLVGTADNTVDRLAVGTDGYTIVADSSSATGLAYAAPAGGGFTFTQIASTSMSGSSTISFTGLTSNYLFLAIEAATVTSNGGNLYVELNGSTASDYAFAGYRINTNSGTLGVVNYRNAGSTPVVSFLIGEEIYTTDGFLNINPYSGTFSLLGCSGTSYKNGNIIGGGFNSTGYQRQIQRNIYYKNTTAVTSLDLKISTSTFSGGTAILYGA